MDHRARIGITVTCLVLLMLGGLGTNTVLGEAEVRPNGPWVTTTQNVNLSRTNDYTQLLAKLDQLETTSKGLIHVEVIAVTNEGRYVHLVQIGDPANDAVLILTQQHGNEMLTTEASLRLAKFLSTGSQQAMRILDNLCVLLVPRVNPDGAEMPWRYNVDTTAPDRNAAVGLFTAVHPMTGWDVNRYHWLDWTDSDLYAYDPAGYPQNPVPEAAAIVDVFQEHQPIWVADMHHQGTYRTDDGENVTSSVLWPRNPLAPTTAVDLSKKMCVAIYDRMQQLGFAAVTLYPGGTYAGICRNAYGIAGAGSILVELKGGIGQKQSGMIIQHAFEQMCTLLEVTASGTLYTLDASRADSIPNRGPYVYPELPPE